MTPQQPSGTATKTIEFTVDGEPFTTTDHDMTAEAILALVRKSFPDHYLVEIKGQRERKEYMDPADVVHVHPGSKFVSVSTGPTPVS